MTRSALTDRLLNLSTEEWLREIHDLTAEQRAEVVADLERRRLLDIKVHPDDLAWASVSTTLLVLCVVVGWLAGWTPVSVAATALTACCALIAQRVVAVRHLRWRRRALREQRVRDLSSADREAHS